MRDFSWKIATRSILFSTALLATMPKFTAKAWAQSAPDGAQTTQPGTMTPGGQSADDQSNSNQTGNNATEQKTFTGVIAKSGDKLVLTDPLTKTSYQLDNQQKAQEMKDKNVKVTGVLDPSTGTIRVSTIEPQ